MPAAAASSMTAPRVNAVEDAGVGRRREQLAARLTRKMLSPVALGDFSLW